MPFSDPAPCSRETDGDMCAPDDCFETSCDTEPPCGEDGTKTVTCTPQICVDGGCGDGTPGESMESCHVETDGISCSCVPGGPVESVCAAGYCAGCPIK